jgi:hypothetical protein
MTGQLMRWMTDERTNGWKVSFHPDVCMESSSFPRPEVAHAELIEVASGNYPCSRATLHGISPVTNKFPARPLRDLGAFQIFHCENTRVWVSVKNMNESIFKSNPSCETQIDFSVCLLIIDKIKTWSFSLMGSYSWSCFHCGPYKHNMTNFYQIMLTIIQI